MGEKTGIAWTDSTWSPVTGCTKLSPGCQHCYAERTAKRFGRGWGSIQLHPERLTTPLQLWVKQASSLRPGQQGDLPDDLWAIKQTPMEERP